MVKQYGMHMSETACVQHACGEWYGRACSSGRWRVCPHEPRPRRLGQYYYPLPQIIVALWHSYVRRLLMQYRLVIVLMSVLSCDKLPHSLLFILHNLLSLSTHWITVWISPLVRFRGNYPSNPPGGFNIHFIPWHPFVKCDVHTITYKIRWVDSTPTTEVTPVTIC